MFCNQLPTSDTTHKWTVALEVGRIHMGALSDVEQGHCGGPQVFGHGTEVLKSCFIINFQLLTPFTSGRTAVVGRMWDPDTGADTKSPAMERMCQIMFYNQLQTSDAIHKWTLAAEGSSSISVLSPMYNPNTGADTKCLAMEPMCQIMFNNQLPTSDTNIHKWTLSPDGSYSTLVSLSMWNADTGADTK